MKCSTVQTLLNCYHDAELDSEKRAEVEHHLAACPMCREALAQLEGVAGTWVAFKTPPMPEGFAERVMRQARKRATPRSVPGWSEWPFLRWWWEQSFAMRAAAAATVAAGLAVGSILGFSNPSANASSHVNPPGAVGESVAALTGAPHGSLEQNYLALAFPSEMSKHSP